MQSVLLLQRGDARAQCRCSQCASHVLPCHPLLPLLCRSWSSRLCLWPRLAWCRSSTRAHPSWHAPTPRAAGTRRGPVAADSARMQPLASLQDSAAPQSRAASENTKTPRGLQSLRLPRV
jgi:hypothetical protein